MTFKKQVALFAESQVILMTHGAALGNALFMSPVSSLICKSNSHQSVVQISWGLTAQSVLVCLSMAIDAHVLQFITRDLDAHTAVRLCKQQHPYNVDL